jgi:RimJ/RimL family protein N-acetyltransferase
MSDRPPVTRTQRLELHPVVEADLDTMLVIHRDPETTRYRPTSPQNWRQLLETWCEDWRLDGVGYWRVVLADTGETIGFGGIRRTALEQTDYLNVYYRIVPAHWGKGYAVEVVRAAAKLAQEVTPSLPVWVITNVDNEQAIRVARKAGFRELRRADFHGNPCVFMELAGQQRLI